MTIAEQGPDQNNGGNRGRALKAGLIAAVVAGAVGIIGTRMETPIRSSAGPTYTAEHFVGPQAATPEGFPLNNGAGPSIEHVPIEPPQAAIAGVFEPSNPNIGPIHTIIDLNLDPMGGEPVLNSDPAMRQLYEDARTFVNSSHPIESTQEFQEFIQTSGDLVPGTLYKDGGIPATFKEAYEIAKEERVTGDTFMTQRLADAYLNHMQQQLQDGTITEDQLAVLELMNEYYREANGYYLAASAVLAQLATLYGIEAMIDPATATISWDHVGSEVRGLLLEDSPKISKELLYFLEELAKNGGIPMSADWMEYFQQLPDELYSDTQNLWEIWDSRTATPAIQSNQ